MLSFRSLLLLSLALLFGGANVSAQTFPLQQQSAQPQQTVQQQQQRIQQVPLQQQPMQQQQIQAPPMQTPQFGTQGNPSIYSQNSAQPATQPGVGQMPVGQIPMGSNAGQRYAAPIDVNQSMRVATANSGVPAGQSVPLYDPNGVNRAPQMVQPPAGQGIPQGMQHIGRAEPANRVIPFFLKPEEQRELDEFLVRWERYSTSINRYDVNFNLFIHNPEVAIMNKMAPDQPLKTAFGYFKYIANPRRFVYAVEGEWQGGKQTKWDKDKNSFILAEKIIIDEKSVYQYDYPAKTVLQLNVPPELIGKGIADSPLPLIFGAKADDLKRRFSMKVERISVNQGNETVDMIRLYARPLYIEDQQEYKELEILLFEKNLMARGLKQWDINGSAFKIYDLRDPVINPKDRFSPLEIIKEWFTADVPNGWKREERNWVAPSPPPPSSIAPATTQPQFANPSNGTPLYRAQ